MAVAATLLPCPGVPSEHGADRHRPDTVRHRKLPIPMVKKNPLVNDTIRPRLTQSGCIPG
jgi:hypothetical protein